MSLETPFYILLLCLHAVGTSWKNSVIKEPDRSNPTPGAVCSNEATHTSEEGAADRVEIVLMRLWHDWFRRIVGDKRDWAVGVLSGVREEVTWEQEGGEREGGREGERERESERERERESANQKKPAPSLSPGRSCYFCKADLQAQQKSFSIIKLQLNLKKTPAALSSFTEDETESGRVLTFLLISTSICYSTLLLTDPETSQLLKHAATLNSGDLILSRVKPPVVPRVWGDEKLVWFPVKWFSDKELESLLVDVLCFERCNWR